MVRIEGLTPDWINEASDISAVSCFDQYFYWVSLHPNSRRVPGTHTGAYDNTLSKKTCFSAACMFLY